MRKSRLSWLLSCAFFFFVAVSWPVFGQETQPAVPMENQNEASLLPISSKPADWLDTLLALSATLTNEAEQHLTESIEHEKLDKQVYELVQKLLLELESSRTEVEKLSSLLAQVKLEYEASSKLSESSILKLQSEINVEVQRHARDVRIWRTAAIAGAGATAGGLLFGPVGAIAGGLIGAFVGVVIP